MCRWVAYAGPEIYLEDLIFHQEHSIVSRAWLQPSLLGSRMEMGLALLGTQNEPTRDCSKMSYLLGMTAIFDHLQLTYKRDYFLHMYVLLQVLLSIEVIAMHSFGKTGPSCITARSAIGMSAERMLKA